MPAAVWLTAVSGVVNCRVAGWLAGCLTAWKDHPGVALVRAGFHNAEVLLRDSGRVLRKYRRCLHMVCEEIRLLFACRLDFANLQIGMGWRFNWDRLSLLYPLQLPAKLYKYTPRVPHWLQKRLCACFASVFDINQRIVRFENPQQYYIYMLPCLLSSSGQSVRSLLHVECRDRMHDWTFNCIAVTVRFTFAELFVCRKCFSYQSM